MTVRILMVLLAATLLSQGFVHAQATVGHDLTTVAYPVAELVVPIGANQEPPQKRATTENALMAHIRKKVAPDAWEQVGGQGSMRYEPKGYVLHVRQTAKVHAELKSFLKRLLREQVALEVRIVAVSMAGFERLDRLDIHWREKDGIKSALLDDVRTWRFFELVQGDRAAHIIQMPTATVFDGQDVELSAGEWSISQGVEFRDKDGVPALTPNLKKTFLGTKARMLPAISADRRYVTLQAEINQSYPTSLQPSSFGEIKLAVAAKVPDRRTVAIVAGTVLTESRTEYGPPVLSKIPYVSRLFRNVGWSRDGTVLLVLLTPRIVRDAEEEVFEVQPLRAGIQANDNGKFPLMLSHGG